MGRPDDIPVIDDIPDVEYPDAPEEIEDAVTGEQYTIEETVKLTLSGEQFIAKIPSEIAEEMELTKGESHMRFSYRKQLPNCDDSPAVDIEPLP